MSRLAAPAADLVAISLLVLGIYFPRHRRRDMVVAFIGVNVGVLAVAQALDATEVGAGLGLGLFGVLSIIRLRSSDIEHQEVAYYFAALALGILGGLDVDPDWLTPVFMVGIIAALYVGDHPALFGSHRSQIVVLDAAYTDEAALRARLENMLGGTVHHAAVRKVDLVDDTTIVDVRYSVPSGEPRPVTIVDESTVWS